MLINIFNYNILSTDLVDPNRHHKCNVQYLSTKYRSKLLLKKLGYQFKQKSIICLQELSDEWISILLPVFLSYNYTFIYDSNFCSPGIAYPNSFSLVKVKFINIGKTIDGENLSDAWDRAKQRRNRLLLIELKGNDIPSFFIGNYHMPCAFKDPSLMMIHASLLLKVIYGYAKNDPCIVCGDFNSTPNSDVYKMITGQTYNDMTPKFTLRSIYNKEPEFTNLSNVSDFGEFCDTIDYIFISNHWKVINVLEMSNQKPLIGYFPNQYEPSDHLPIGATLSF